MAPNTRSERGFDLDRPGLAAVDAAEVGGPDVHGHEKEVKSDLEESEAREVLQLD